LGELPKGRKPIICEWVFQIKRKANKGVDCYKARLVVKGFSQICGVDFDETYAHVTKVILIRNLLASATTLDLEIHQMDVKNVFLNGKFQEEVYMMQPKGFEKTNHHVLVCKLNKAT